jgi:hypothetical protein
LTFHPTVLLIPSFHVGLQIEIEDNYGNYIQTIIQVLPEFTCLDRLLQVLVGRGHDPGAERSRAVSSQPQIHVLFI